jgi:type II secretory pathway pseudopilin PulG
MMKTERGFTYVALLFAVAVIGVGLAAKGVEWDRTSQRAREAELLFVGSEFRKAIALYYYRSPGPVQEYPKSLEELLEDRRYPGAQRYLRRVYRDPMTGRAEWGLVLAPGGGVMGVHSLSEGQVIKSGNFTEANRDFATKGTYKEWQFNFAPATAPAASGSLPK